MFLRESSVGTTRGYIHALNLRCKFRHMWKYVGTTNLSSERGNKSQNYAIGVKQKISTGPVETKRTKYGFWKSTC